MDQDPKKSVAVSLREWGQFVLLLFAAAWGVYTFIQKEVIEPKSVPINVSMTLEARQSGASTKAADKAESQLVAIEIKVTAKNPSTRVIYLLKSVWYAYAWTVTRRKASDPTRELGDMLKSDGIVQTNLFARYDNGALVATGTLFEDSDLKPGEVLNRTIVFYVPRGVYDQIRVGTEVPSVSKPGYVFERTAKDGDFDKSAVYRVTRPATLLEGRSGKKTEAVRELLPTDENDNILDKSLEFQRSVSSADMSLWSLPTAP